MELVTLGRAKLNRIGTASGRGFGSDRSVEVVREIPNATVDALRELVLTVAQENNEQRDALKAMTQHQDHPARLGRSIFVFDIQGPNTMYSNPYAECEAFPALKVGDRYFKLEEIRT